MKGKSLFTMVHRWNFVRRLCVAVVVIALPACTSSVDPTGVSRLEASRSVSSQSTGSTLFRPNLEDRDVPLDIVLIGDTSGKSLGGWVFLFGQGLGAATSRPVVIRPREVKPSGQYTWAPPIEVWKGGDSKPVRIWNISLDKDIAYLEQNLDLLLGEVKYPRLVLVSNGYSNPSYRTLGRSSVRFVNTLDKLLVGAEVRFIIQPFQDPDSIGAANQQDVMRSVQNEGYAVIDVAGPFLRSKRADLFSNSLFPNVDGYRLWSKVVLQDLLGEDR